MGYHADGAEKSSGLAPDSPPCPPPRSPLPRTTRPCPWSQVHDEVHKGDSQMWVALVSVSNRGHYQRSYQRQNFRGTDDSCWQQPLRFVHKTPWHGTQGPPKLTMRLCGDPGGSPTAVAETRAKTMHYTVNRTSCYGLQVRPRKCKVEVHELGIWWLRSWSGISFLYSFIQ